MSVIDTVLKNDRQYYVIPPQEYMHEQYIKPIQSDMELICRRVSRTKRKANPTYGGWRHKRMYK